MVEGIAGAGLPPAHVGLHSGPIVIQEGDYYGQTVNLAAGSRITRVPARCS
jgi:class 3 adenylate cyclase